MMKKIIAIATALTVSVWLVGPGVAQAVTAEELQAQINALLSQLTALQTQLAGMGGGNATGTVCTFTRNLYPGVARGDDVKCLQQYLNSVGHPVAASGYGSPGQETTYYGSLTTAAVSGWQTAKGVACGAWCGYFGPISQAKYTALQAGGGGVVCGNGTCETGETHTSCPGDCPTTTCGNGTCDTGESNNTCPADCAASACTAEGSFSVILSASPVSRTVNAGAGIEALGIDITANNSDMTVGRVDFQATVTALGVGENPGNFITGIKVYDTSVSDANLKKTVTSPVFTQDAGGLWYTQLSDLNFVVTKGTTKKLLVVIDTGTTIDLNRIVTVGTYPGTATGGIRARDCKGIDNYLGLVNTRQLTVQNPGVATVAISQAVDNPLSNNVKADPTNGVQTNESLLSLSAKASAGSAALLRLQVRYASAASSSVLPSILYLYDGDTLVSSVTPTNTSTAVFENFVLPLTQDVAKNLKIKANWAANAAFQSGGAAFVLNVPVGTAADGITGVYQRGNGQQLGIINGTAIASNTKWISESGLKLTFISGTATYVPEAIAGGVGIAKGTLVFKAVPFGGTLIEPAYASDATTVAAGTIGSGMLVNLVATVGGAAPVASADLTLTYDLQSSLGVGANVAEDQEVTVTTRMEISKTVSTTNGTTVFKINDICYNVGSPAANPGVCQGTTSGIGGAGTGNLTDNWVTNTVNMTP